MFKEIKVILLGLFCGVSFQQSFAAAENDFASVYDFIHMSRDKTLKDYVKLHAFLEKWSWEQKQAFMNYRADHEETALHRAVRQRNLAAVYFLLQHGADRTLKDANEHTAFDLAKDYTLAEQAFFDFYAYPRERRTEQAELLEDERLAAMERETWEYVNGFFNGSVFRVSKEYAVNWGAAEFLLCDFPRPWLREKIVSRYDGADQSFLYKAIYNGRADWILFLLQHNVDSKKMIKGLSLTYKDVVNQKIERHVRLNGRKHPKGLCFKCEWDRKILLLLEIYQFCFEKPDAL